MKNGRIILTAQLTNQSPIGIGSGRDDRTDRDVVTTNYLIGFDGSILPTGRLFETEHKAQLPFIPASSFMGKIFRYFDVEKYSFLNKYWGESEKNASYIDCSDILITKLPNSSRLGSVPTEIRDGIRLNSTKGTVADGAKFDYELLAPGAKFDLVLIFRVEQLFSGKENKVSNYDDVHILASDIARIIERGFDLGAKSTIGYGKMIGTTTSLYELDFENSEHFNQWINCKLDKNPLEKTSATYLLSDEKKFEIKATFSIRNSLIIRSYSKDPKAPDTTHLKSGGRNILSGSSIKGALRGRAERILNTIQNDVIVTQTIIADLFGDVEKENDGVTVKKNGYTVPSRVFVDEIPIDEVNEEIQTRIQTEGFTGGTVDGALVEEAPLFPIKEKNQISNFSIRIVDAQTLDMGLMLLLLKDLWSADLPIGGEKSIGRGVLEGKKATVNISGTTYCFPEVLKNKDEVQKLQQYVDALAGLASFDYSKNRVFSYITKKL